VVGYNPLFSSFFNLNCKALPMQAPQHIAVMPAEVIELLSPEPGGVFVDGTLGAGGHTRLLAEAVGDNGEVISVDRDPQAIEAAAINLKGLPVKVAQASYTEIPQILNELGVERVDGILLDVGLSSDQLADETRGFSFESDGDLDMRFDPDSGEPAWRLLARLREKDIADLIYNYGEERASRQIARRIVEARKSEPIRTAAQLAQLVRRCVRKTPGQKINPATRTFQALRIAVNGELDALERALQSLPAMLRKGGRLAIISFHSLEDRLVKNAFRDHPLLEPITRKPVLASAEELDTNPRSRSAKLRVAARTAT